MSKIDLGIFHKKAIEESSKKNILTRFNLMVFKEGLDYSNFIGLVVHPVWIK